MDAQLLKLVDRVLLARKERMPLRLHAAGTKDFYGASTESTPDESGNAGVPLDLRGHSGVIDYVPSELVIRVRCGTPLAQVETVLAEHNQFLAFEPPSFGGRATIGGVVSAGLSGPRRMQVGAVRDFVLGATLMTSDGQLLKFGGQVMKNVAGFDVARLLCGSLGIFGILTDVALKVLPQPRAQQTVRLEMPASEALTAFNRWAGQPLPVSGAAWHAGAAWIRFSGAAPAVQAAVAAIGGDRVFPALAGQWWDALRH